MAKQSLTDFEHILLGLLALAPMSGYDVKKAFASSPLGHFSPSSGGIYPALRRLEKLGLLSASIDRTSEVRARRVYRPTSAGLGALDTWLQQPVDREMVARQMDFVLMRFALMEGRSSRAQAIVYLEQLRQELAAHVVELETYARATGKAASLHQRLALRHGVEGYRASLAWTEAALAELRAADAEDLTTETQRHGE